MQLFKRTAVRFRTAVEFNLVSGGSFDVFHIVLLLSLGEDAVAVVGVLDLGKILGNEVCLLVEYYRDYGHIAKKHSLCLMEKLGALCTVCFLTDLLDKSVVISVYVAGLVGNVDVVYSRHILTLTREARCEGSKYGECVGAECLKVDSDNLVFSAVEVFGYSFVIDISVNDTEILVIVYGVLCGCNANVKSKSRPCLANHLGDLEFYLIVGANGNAEGVVGGGYAGSGNVGLSGSGICAGGDDRTANSAEELIALVVVEYAIGNDSVSSLCKYDSLRDSATVDRLGKSKTDFLVCKKLLDFAGVKYDAHYRITSVDPPELVRFIKTEYPDVKMEHPYWEKDGRFHKAGDPITMWNLIPEKLMPPTQIVRYCCEALKESGGDGRLTVTGVRWAESSNRKANQGLVTIMGNKKQNQEMIESGNFQQTRKSGVILVNDNDEARNTIEQCYRRRKTILNPYVLISLIVSFYLIGYALRSIKKDKEKINLFERNISDSLIRRAVV